MVVTLAGSSRLAGTYHGYGAFSEYLDALRDVLRAADEQIRFEHDGDRMIFTHAVVISGPHHQVEMDLRVTVVFHADGRVQLFLAELEDQGLFDYVVNTAAHPSEIRWRSVRGSRSTARVRTASRATCTRPTPPVCSAAGTQDVIPERVPQHLRPLASWIASTRSSGSERMPATSRSCSVIS